MAGIAIVSSDDSYHRSSSRVSEIDAPHRLGNTSIEDDSLYTELQATASASLDSNSKDKWEVNYHEAAIFLEEGKNNEKFSSHPKSKKDLPSYLIVHHHFFYSLDLFSCIILMSLVVAEKPAVPLFELSPGVHASLELFALFTIAAQLGIKVRWLGIKELLHHKRTVLKVLCLLIMFIEAVVVIVRQKSHFRVTRSLRPMFLIDNHYCGGLRRFIRQILQSLGPILDMLILILFFMLIFATLGNYPDVMMPAYNTSRWSAIFFITYLVINLYFLMNLMLAVVYEKFTSIEKDKFRKLLMHKRRACCHAFRLLVSKSHPSHIKYRHFEGLMRYHRPKACKRDVYLTFKTLDSDNSGFISLEEFYYVYEVCSLKWKPKRPEIPWFEGIWKPLRLICSGIRKVVLWKYFELIINVVVLCQGVWQVLDAAYFFYSLEAILKLLGMGLITYLSNGWDVYDLLITVFSIAGIIAESFHAPFYFIVTLRPLRLLRLFKMKKRYRDVFGTVFILLSRLVSVAIVLVITYYFFAVIGMELFSHYNMVNCCQNSSVAANYKFSSGHKGYYYMNNFQDIFHAGVTLFELTVVNNWFIIMNGFAAVSSEWSRIYFMIFYIVTMVVLQIIVAFILEAFLFRIQYKRKMGDMDKDTLVKVDIGLSRQELDFCYSKSSSIAELTSYSQVLDASNGDSQLTYRGVRRRTKSSFYMKMYGEEVKEWLMKEEEEEKRHMALLQEMIHNNELTLPISRELDLARRTRSI
ncbi:Two pore calcium channel protein 1 [Nymphon striatum]|nr:Two pore calcium channel protein 1 [Nymphon striatum]